MKTKNIKRIVCLALATLLLSGLLPVASRAAAGATIYFDNTAGWSTVKIYYWSDADTTMTTWPGETMAPVEGTIYSFTVPADATMVIFNNGSGTQTADLSIPADADLYTYGSGWSAYEKGCDHDWDTGEITAAPTCTAAGIRTYNCSLCGASATEAIAATGHSMTDGRCTLCGAQGQTVYFDNANGWDPVKAYFWSDADTDMTAWPGEDMTLVEGSVWSHVLPAEAQYVIFTDGSQQTDDLTIPGSGYLYSSGEWSEYDVCAHSWDAGTVTTAPTCTAEGLMTYTCILCGQTSTDPIAATGHSYESGACALCGAVEGCVDHVWDEGTVTQAATCWVAGVMTYTCTLCGQTSTSSIKAGHDRYVAEIVAPTCTATGKEITKCTRCAYSYSKTLPKIDHSYAAGEVMAPTCTTDGYTVSTCTGCGAIAHTDPVYHTGHSWSDETCTTCGLICEHSYSDGICIHCHKGGPAYVDGYYEIANAAQLYWFAVQVNSGNDAINGRLIADIDLDGGTWTSIGYYSSDTLEPGTVAYRGIFDGQGHTVSDFVTAGTDNEGLFGYCSSATIMNVGVVGATITGWRAGAVAGYPLTSNVIGCFAKDCTIIGYTTNSVALLSGSVHIAPIASPQGGIVQNCYAVNCTLIDDTDLTVNATPVGGTDTQNGYYFNTVFEGTFSSTRNSTAVTMDQLTSGEVTYLLNGGITDGTQSWYQTCGTGMPAHSGETVYAVTDCGGTSVTYANAPGSAGHSYENGSCTACGGLDPDYVAAPGITMSYPTLSFEDEIYYNVYCTVDDMTNVVELGLITFSSRLADGTIADAVETIPGYITSGSNYIVRSSGIPAKELGDALYFKVYAKLADGTYAYSDVAGYNAIVYANTILNSTSTSDAAKSLVVAMLNYGAAAQTYFGYNTDSLMNAGLTAEQQALVAAYDETMVDDVVKADSGKTGIFVNNGGWSSIFPSVSFEGAFAINYYFAAKYTPDAAPTFYWWDAETYANAEELTAENASGTISMVQDDDYWYGMVEGIAAKQIDQTFYTAGLYTVDGTTYYSPVISYSLGSYCETLAAQGNAFGAATAVYGYYAKAYFEGLAG